MNQQDSAAAAATAAVAAAAAAAARTCYDEGAEALELDADADGHRRPSSVAGSDASETSLVGVETAPGIGAVTGGAGSSTLDVGLGLGVGGVGGVVGRSTVRRVYRCPQCSFWATTASRFHVHMVGHTNTKPFECSQCAYRSNWRSVLRFFSIFSHYFLFAWSFFQQLPLRRVSSLLRGSFTSTGVVYPNERLSSHRGSFTPTGVVYPNMGRLLQRESFIPSWVFYPNRGRLPRRRSYTPIAVVYPHDYPPTWGRGSRP